MQINHKNRDGLQNLVKHVQELKSDPRVREMVETRVEEFRQVYGMNSLKWYEELVYCLLTAFASAVMGQKCVDKLTQGDLLLGGFQRDIQECLTMTGHRFPNVRSEYIFNTRPLAHTLKETIQGFNTSSEARVWLVKNVKGLGWKEASHFLRNVGVLDLAIIDRHILNNLREFGLIEMNGRESLTGKRYLAIEELLGRVAGELGMELGELDLYMWYRKTGKVLK